MKDDPLVEASALEQGRLIATRKLSSEELTRVYLGRIEALDGELGAFVDTARDRAILEARRFDRARPHGPRTPLYGVPTAVKDLNLAKGMFTRFGSRAFQKLYAFVDDATTARLREGGMVILGKTATSELGTLPVVETDIHPPSRNPWNTAFTSGGSSGGAGAAVAAGLVPLAQGSDGAGSIRIPSSFCNLFGIKPSRGRVRNSFGQPDQDIIYTCGPLARTVEDAAAMLDVLAGLSVGTPHWAPPPTRTFLELCRRPPPRLRVRFTTLTHLAPTHPDVDRAVRRVVALLEAMGHVVEEGTMMDGTVEEFLPIWQTIAASAPVHDWNDTQPITRWLADKGRGVTPAQGEEIVRSFGRRVATWFGDADVWITPTVPGPPPRVGAFSGLAPAEAFARYAELGPFTAPFNVGGQPAASLPAGFTAEGLPIGVQIAGKPFADALVLALARTLEEAMPWRRLAPRKEAA